MPDDATEILAIERVALTRYAQGDPDGCLEICDPGVTYFDPFQSKRLDGLPALSALYGSIRGQVQFTGFDILNPAVVISGDMALLTYNFQSEGETLNRWNTTEVYRKSGSRWLLIHSHWSLTTPKLAESQ